MTDAVTNLIKFDGDAPKFPEVQAVVPFLKEPTDEVLLVELLQKLGDLAREEPNRNVISAAVGPFTIFLPFLAHKNTNLPRLSLRLLGNMCFDNKANREKLMEMGLEPVLSHFSSTEPQILRMACGCVANLCADTEKACDLIFENKSHMPILGLLDNTTYDVVMLALTALRNILYTDEHRLEIQKQGGYDKLIQMLIKPTMEDVEDTVVSAITAMCETKSMCLDFINKQNGLVILSDMMEKHEEMAVKLAAGESLKFFSEEEDLRIKFMELGLIPRLYKMTAIDSEETKALSTSASKVYSNLSLNDDIAKSMYGDLDNVLVLFKHSNNEVQVAASMICGNLARSEENCIKLVDDTKLHIKLIKLLNDEDTDLRCKHLCIGCLKNLCIPVVNKRKIFDAGAFQALMGIFKATENGPTIWGVIGIFKSLLSTKEQDVIDTFVKLDALSICIKEATKSEYEHVKYDAARIVGALCQTDSLAARIAKLGGCVPLVNLLSSKFDLLNKEGSIAVHSLSGHDALLGVIGGTKDLIQNLIKVGLTNKDDSTRMVALKALQNLYKEASNKECITSSLNKKGGDYWALMDGDASDEIKKLVEQYKELVTAKENAPEEVEEEDAEGKEKTKEDKKEEPTKTTENVKVEEIDE